MGFLRAVKFAAVTAAIGTVIYLYEPNFIKKADILVEGIAKKVEETASKFFSGGNQLDKNKENSGFVPDVTGKYSCDLLWSCEYDPSKHKDFDRCFKKEHKVKKKTIDVEVCENKSGELQITEPFTKNKIGPRYGLGELKEFEYPCYFYFQKSDKNPTINSVGILVQILCMTIRWGGKVINREGDQIILKAQRWRYRLDEREDYLCTFQDLCELDKPQKSHLKKAVFIRPCEGQFYKSFKDKEPNVADTAVGRVCKDIRKSGVTDVFIAFKVDHEGKGCGNYGELLYPSKLYPNNVSISFKDAHTNGFDPIKEIMDSIICKGIDFHAWFPVFKDPFAVAYAEKKGVYGGVEATGPADSKGLYPKPLISKTYANPSIAEVVEYELNLLTEILKKYPKLVGVNLDYIRYPSFVEFKMAYISDRLRECKEKNKKCEEAGIEKELAPYSNIVVDSEAVTSFVQKVSKQFPNVILSADVMAGEDVRKTLGQDGILTHLKWIMPMGYIHFGGFGGPEAVVTYYSQLKTSYPSKTVFPILRGWLCRMDEKCSITETTQQFEESLKAGILLLKSLGAPGYAVFTYESLLMDAEFGRLAEIKKIIQY